MYEALEVLLQEEDNFLSGLTNTEIILITDLQMEYSDLRSELEKAVTRLRKKTGYDEKREALWEEVRALICAEREMRTEINKVLREAVVSRDYRWVKSILDYYNDLGPIFKDEKSVKEKQKKKIKKKKW